MLNHFFCLFYEEICVAFAVLLPGLRFQFLPLVKSEKLPVLSPIEALTSTVLIRLQKAAAAVNDIWPGCVNSSVTTDFSPVVKLFIRATV